MALACAVTGLAAFGIFGASVVLWNGGAAVFHLATHLVERFLA
jgi:hypothetical protein